ncbi:hypothetical protein C8R47DRAFT_654677 [Mycena vitilis]|nr:hypothetical protein C8R47DRAFT_654677 [Mycena vitilis]
MADPLGIVQGVFELGMAIKESIDKVADNKENLVELKKEVMDTVEELGRLANGTGNEAPTGQLKTALEMLTKQLDAINTNCLELTQSRKISDFVKAWFNRDKIEAEIKKLNQNRTRCCAEFQLLSLVRVEGTAARTEKRAVLIEATSARTEGHAARAEATTARTEATTARTEATTARTEATTARAEANTIQLVNSARKAELRGWFQAVDMKEKQHATHALRHDDTGRWVLEDTKFAKWKEQPGCLWIRGISGTGKSVLSSIAIDHLFDYRREKVANSNSATPNFGIAYFYFDFRDETKQRVETMLRSIIMQLSEQSPTPYSVLDQHFKSCQGGKLPTYSDLLVMLNSVLAQFAGTYVVLDALDECSEHDDLVQSISTLRGWGKPVHLLVASQPRTLFLESAVFDEASVVLLESETTHSDILQFVESELASKSKLKHIKKAKDAAPKIVNKSNGMFRMAACLLQELARKKIVTDIDKILAKLPDDLFGIYTRFLRPVDEDDFVYVTRFLRWVAFSRTQVTMRQLDEALAINFHEPDRWVFEPEDRGRAESVCGLLEGLVTVGPVSGSDSDSSSGEDPEDQEQPITLAHSSVNDYIMSQKFLDQYKHDLGEAPSHTFLAQSCITYFLHFENNPLNADTLPQYPLAMYAAQFWSHHLLRCQDRGVLQHSTMHLLEQGSQQYVALNCMWDTYGTPWLHPDWSRPAPSPLSLCSAIGYVEGVQYLLDRGADVNATGGHFGSALQAAASEGHKDIVHFLLDHGADVNAMGGRYGSALQSSASRGHIDLVRLFLERGADVNAAGGIYGSALQAAVTRGQMGIVRLLLEKGADVNAMGGRYGSALQAAVTRGHMGIVRLLLEKGADVNAMGGRYGSALQAAAARGHTDIVRLLLEKGADVNATGGRYGSAVGAASAKGHKEIASLLREHGALEAELDKNSELDSLMVH